MHIHTLTFSNTTKKMQQYLPSLHSLSFQVACLPFLLSFTALPLLYLSSLLPSPLPIDSCFKIFSEPHFFLQPVSSAKSHIQIFFFPLFFFFPFSVLTFPLSLSSFDGLVVGATDSVRLELLSQCEMYCCGDNMSHFTLDWWCV